MKKTICIIYIILLGVATNSMVAQTIKVKGTYQGKPITIEYQEGASGKDYVSSITYKPYEDLLKDKARIEGDKNKLEKKANELEKQVKDLQKKLNDKGRGPVTSDTAAERLQKELSNAQSELNELKTSFVNKEKEIAQLERAILQWKNDLQDTTKVLENTRRELVLTNQLASQYAEDIAVIKEKKLDNHDAVNLRICLSSSSMNNNLTKQEFWNQEATLGQSYQLTYTKYFSTESSVAITVGAGLGSYKFSANVPFMEETLRGTKDPDGEEMNISYLYSDIRENVSLTYLDIPIELHIGNNTSLKGVQLWIDAGIQLGVNLRSNFVGSGEYSNYGYYPQWDMHVNDAELLGLKSKADVYNEYTQWELNRMVLWVTSGVGAFIPLGDYSNWGVSIGARCAYSLTPISKEVATGGAKFEIGTSNLLGGEGTRIFNLGVTLGLSYTLKPNKVIIPQQ